jgi:hypothetical protein
MFNQYFMDAVVNEQKRRVEEHVKQAALVREAEKNRRDAKKSRHDVGGSSQRQVVYFVPEVFRRLFVQQGADCK